MFSVVTLNWLEKVVTFRTDWMSRFKYDANVVYIILIHAILSYLDFHDSFLGFLSMHLRSYFFFFFFT